MWVCFVNQEQYAKADAHFYLTEMPKYLDRLRMFVHLVKTQRENQLKMVEFRRLESLSGMILWTLYIVSQPL